MRCTTLCLTGVDATNPDVRSGYLSKSLSTKSGTSESSLTGEILNVSMPLAITVEPDATCVNCLVRGRTVIS